MNNQNESGQNLVNSIDDFIDHIKNKPRNQSKVWMTKDLHDQLIQDDSYKQQIPHIHEKKLNFRIISSDSRGFYAEHVLYDSGYETPIDLDFNDIDTDTDTDTDTETETETETEHATNNNEH